VHHLPVLSGQKVVGMISSADVTKIEAFLPKGGEARADYLSQHMKIATLMHKPALTIRPHATLLEAARLMAANAIHALPVVNEEDCLLGIITTTDIMHAALAGQPPEQPAASAGQGQVPVTVEMSAAELEHALTAARTAVAAGQDVDGVAMGLMCLQHRVALLEHVLQSAERYLQLGQDRTQLAALRAAIAAARRAHAAG
jgi:CBS domain-containing protein